LISQFTAYPPQSTAHSGIFFKNFSHFLINPVWGLISGKNTLVEKIKIEKFGNQVGKSVILCQFKKI